MATGRGKLVGMADFQKRLQTQRHQRQKRQQRRRPRGHELLELRQNLIHGRISIKTEILTTHYKKH